MSKATNARKLQNALQSLDDLSLSLWDVSLPVGALDITLHDEHKNEIEITLDDIIYTVEKHLKTLMREQERQALENWNKF